MMCLILKFTRESGSVGSIDKKTDGKQTSVHVGLAVFRLDTESVPTKSHRFGLYFTFEVFYSLLPMRTMEYIIR